MTNEVKNVPQLRFPNFDGEWEECKLEEISDKVTEKNKNNQFSETLTNSAEYGVISQRDFFDKDISNEKNLNGYYIVQEDDFVYNPRISNFAPVGPIKRNKLGRTGVMSPLYYVFRTRNIDVVFLDYYFETTGWHKFMKLNGDSGARADRFAIKDLIFKTMPIPYPIIEEQEKIGNFFSKLDQQIELEEQKLSLLEEQKKGYMQQIFSQKLRFKDENGNDYPNWETEKLGDLINEVNERTTSNNQYVLLSSTKNGLLSQEKYFKKQIGSKDSTGYKVLRLNQLVLSPQNLWLGNINFNQCFDIGIVSPSYRIYNLSHHFDINFAKNLLKSPRYIYEYAQASEQGASVVRRNLNLDLFYSIKISLPSIEEQRKIGVFLNKYDKCIQKQSNKIELLKQRKKGFLQRMFV